MGIFLVFYARVPMSLWPGMLKLIGTVNVDANMRNFSGQVKGEESHVCPTLASACNEPALARHQ